LVLYTIGYSNFFESDKFINRLKELKIEYLIDVRTFPYSKTFSQYDEPVFKRELLKVRIKHTFLGDYIGGLVVKSRVKKGISKVEDLLDVKEFRDGMNRLYKFSKNYRVAIMCAEKDPMNCHRFLAVGYLMEKIADVKVINLIGNERKENFDETLNKFKKENKLENLSFSNEQIFRERLNLLYKIQNKREEKEKPKMDKNKTLF